MREPKSLAVKADAEIHTSISDVQEMVKEHENLAVKTQGTEGVQLKEKKVSTM